MPSKRRKAPNADDMAEPRQRARAKGAQYFDDDDLRAFLYAYGDDKDPLPETVKLLDEITTDFIIETCHVAQECASYSHRQKCKQDDFKFAIRRDPTKLGRVAELLTIQKSLQQARKVESMNDPSEIAKEVLKKEGPGKGRKKKKDVEAEKA